MLFSIISRLGGDGLSASCSGVSASRGSRTNRSSSRRTAATSSYRVTNQIIALPSMPGWQKTGSSARIVAKVEYGSARNVVPYRSYFLSVTAMRRAYRCQPRLGPWSLGRSG